MRQTAGRLSGGVPLGTGVFKPSILSLEDQWRRLHGYHAVGEVLTSERID